MPLQCHCSEASATLSDLILASTSPSPPLHREAGLRRCVQRQNVGKPQGSKQPLFRKVFRGGFFRGYSFHGGYCTRRTPVLYSSVVFQCVRIRSEIILFERVILLWCSESFYINHNCYLRYLRFSLRLLSLSLRGTRVPSRSPTRAFGGKFSNTKTCVQLC